MNRAEIELVVSHGDGSLNDRLVVCSRSLVGRQGKLAGGIGERRAPRPVNFRGRQ